MSKKTVVAPVQEQLVSAINFTRLIGMAHPQQMYQMLGKGQVPEEVLTRVAVGDKVQPFFKVEAGLEWWNGRKAAKAGKTVNVISNPDQVIARFVDMVDQAGKADPEVAKLAEALKKVFELAQGGEKN